MSHQQSVSIAPSQLWIEMSTMPRPHRIVDFPRRNPATGEPIGQVAIWPLTQQEQIQSAVAAEKVLAERFKGIEKERSIGYDAAYSNTVVVEILFRACRDTKNLDLPAFPSAHDLRTAITPDESAVLFEAYLAMTTEVGPIISALSKGDVDGWIDRLRIGGQQIDPLDSCSSGMLRVLARALVDRLGSSTTQPSSAGSLHGPSTYDELEVPDDEGIDE